MEEEKVEKHVQDFIEYMRKISMSDSRLEKDDEQRGFDNGWNCAVSYAADKLKRILLSG